MTPPKIHAYHQFFMSTTGPENVIFEIEAILDGIESIVLSDPNQDVWVRVGSQFARPSWTQSAAGALHFIRSQQRIYPPCIQITPDERIIGIVGTKEYNGATQLGEFLEAAMAFYKVPRGKINKLMERNFSPPDDQPSYNGHKPDVIELPAVPPAIESKTSA